MAMSTLVWRMPSRPRFPRVDDGAVDEVAVVVPVGIGTPGEGARDVVPVLPALLGDWDQPGGRTAGYGDLDFLTALNASHEFGCVLTQFA